MDSRAAAIGIVLLASASLAGADKRVEVDPKTDFSVLKTFELHEGVASSRNPEIANRLTIRKVEDAIRAELGSRGLTETPDRPDLIVTFRVTETGQRGAPPPGQRGARQLSAGTLIIDLTKRDTNNLVWHGVYTDTVESPGTLAARLPADARKLLSEFPPKKKK